MTRSNQRTASGRAAVAGLALLMLVLAFPAGSVRAGLGFFYDVTSLADTVAADGACTLREAITSANGSTTDCGRGSSGEAGIGFSVDGTIVLSSPLPTITNDMGIDGTGRSIAISGNSAVSIFSVNGATLWLTKLTVVNGVTGLLNTNGTVHVTGSLFAGNSERAIRNEGSVTVAQSTFSRNGSTSTTSGAAIYNFPGASLTITASRFVHNVATGHHGIGGAIFNNRGTVTISHSTFVRNVASEQGSAISSFEGMRLDIANSTFIANDAPVGALFVEGGSLALWNATVAENTGGGALYMYGGSHTVTNSTFVGNTAPGGLVTTIVSDGGSATFRNTLVSGTMSGTSCGASAGSISDGGGNLSWPDTSCPGLKVDPKLDAGLRNNGGPTLTVALRWNSPAIDRGNATTCRVAPINDRDQRGGSRSIDGDRDGVARCDIGALEYGGLIPPAPTLVSATKVTGGEKLVWSRVRDALRYRVEVRKAGTLVATRTTTTTVTVTIPLAAGSYTWTVQACNTLGCKRCLVGSFTR
jgi:CSLREA domain-containing protein